MSCIDILRKLLMTRDERGHQTSDWFRLVVRRSVRQIIGSYNGEILDAGGGDGLLFDPCVSSLAGKTTLLDIEEPVLRIAKEHYQNLGAFVLGDMTRMPFRDGAFSLSVCIGTFYNFLKSEMVQKGIDELTRVTKKGGRILVEFRNGDSILVKSIFHHANRYDMSLCQLPLEPYSLNQIRNMIVKAHLRIVAVRRVRFPVTPFIFSYIIEATHQDQKSNQNEY